MNPIEMNRGGWVGWAGLGWGSLPFQRGSLRNENFPAHATQPAVLICSGHLFLYRVGPNVSLSIPTAAIVLIFIRIGVVVTQVFLDHQSHKNI